MILHKKVSVILKNHEVVLSKIKNFVKNHFFKFQNLLIIYCKIPKDRFFFYTFQFHQQISVTIRPS